MAKQDKSQQSQEQWVFQDASGRFYKIEREELEKHLMPDEEVEVFIKNQPAMESTAQVLGQSEGAAPNPMGMAGSSFPNPNIGITPGAGVRMVPGAGVRMVPGVGVRMVPDAGVRMVPGAGVRMVPGAGVRMVPGAGVRMVPGAGVRMVPGAGVRMVPSAGVRMAPAFSSQLVSPYAGSPIIRSWQVK